MTDPALPTGRLALCLSYSRMSAENCLPALAIRRFAIFGAFVALLSVPSWASANTVTLTDFNTAPFANNAPGGGGPFQANASDLTLGVSGSFITFCIEFNEEFNYGATYKYVLNGGAVNGGVGGQDASGTYDPLDDATKWLYAEVVSGGYGSIAAFGSGPDASDHASRRPSGSLKMKGPRRRSIALSYHLAQYAKANWTTLPVPGYSIFAMNLTDIGNPRGLHQDQLTYRHVQITELDANPVPSPRASCCSARASCFGAQTGPSSVARSASLDGSAEPSPEAALCKFPPQALRPFCPSYSDCSTLFLLLQDCIHSPAGTAAFAVKLRAARTCTNQFVAENAGPHGREGARAHEAKEHDLPLVRQGRARGGALLRRHVSRQQSHGRSQGAQ